MQSVFDQIVPRSPILRVRNWLICCLAGKSPVVLNAKVSIVGKSFMPTGSSVSIDNMKCGLISSNEFNTTKTHGLLIEQRVPSKPEQSVVTPALKKWSLE